jgi:MFS transporter, ACS family, D-galactonate transporter
MKQCSTSSPRPGAAVQRTRWSVVVLLMALCFISHMNRVSMSIAGDERIMAEYGITPKQMGIVYSAFLLIYTLFMLPGGWFIDRFGVRAALGLMALGTAFFGSLTGIGAIAAAGSLWLWLILVRSVMGFFTVPLHPASARAVGLWLPAQNQTLANGLITGAALLGIACTFPVFGALIDWLDWPRAFTVTGICTAVLGALWLFVMRNLPRPSAAPSAVLNWRGFASPSLVLLTLSYAAIGYFQYLFFYWLHYYFDTVLVLGKMESRLFAALPVLAMAFTMPLGGWLSTRAEARHGWRAGRVYVAGLAMLGAAICFAFGIAAQAHPWTVIAFTLALASLGLSEAAFWQTAIELGGARGGTAAALMNTSGNGIGLLAPIFTPLIAERLGWKAGLGMGALVCLAGALCWLWIRPAPATNDARNYESNRP